MKGRARQGRDRQTDRDTKCMTFHNLQDCLQNTSNVYILIVDNEFKAIFCKTDKNVSV